MRHDLPPAPPGLTIGLFGGSFDPVHHGHLRLSMTALRRLGLDRLWWLVSPGNPLKRHGPAPLAQRIAGARARISDPRIHVTGVEQTLGTRQTASTLAALQRLYPRNRFVWIMGADNLAGLHNWAEWHRIMERVPVAVLARPGQRLAALCSKAAQRYRARRLPAHRALELARHPAPAWCFLNMPMSAESSSRLRCCDAAPHDGASRHLRSGSGA